MNVKTLSILIQFSIASIFVLLTLFFLFVYKGGGYLPMQCMSTFYINLGKNDDITGSIKIVIHNTDDGLMVINEYGALKYNGQEFIVNRSGSMNISKVDKYGFHKVTKGNFVSNPLDTAPAEIIEKLTSRQSVFYYKIQKIDDFTWRISDLQRTIFICRSFQTQ